jgi:enoyl-CoA hydratase/carnithine racemase
MTVFKEITYDQAGPVAVISLNRPELRNAYTVRMGSELERAFGDADGDDSVRAVVLTSVGDDFCVGADFRGAVQQGPRSSAAGAAGPSAWREPAGRCSLRIFSMNKPVVAAITGAAVGAGLSITLPCDIRLAADDARFGFVFARRGMYPEGASAWFLPRLVGLGRSLEWMITGRVFDAAEGLSAGLVHGLHPAGEVRAQACALATRIAQSTAPVSAAVIRRMLYWACGTPSPADVQEVDSRLVASLLSQGDALEGASAFLARRAPRFTGRVPEDLPGFLPWLAAGD